MSITIKKKSSVFIIGGAYSGKSEFIIEKFRSQNNVCVLGTGLIQSQQTRIQALKKFRPSTWASMDLSHGLLETYKTLEHDTVIIDSLNQWLASYIETHHKLHDFEQIEHMVLQEIHEIFDTFSSKVEKKASHILVMVSLEAGHCPPQPLPEAQLYRKLLGLINQNVAKFCGDVIFLECGIPRKLK